MTIARITRLPDLPERPDDSHKGTFGRVLIAAGSVGMGGAAALAGLGALRGGAGLVRLAVPESLLVPLAATEPSFLLTPLPEDSHGRTAGTARSVLAPLLSDQSAIAIGPGWGQSEQINRLIHWFFTQTRAPLVIDADGLNALARTPSAWETRVKSAAGSEDSEFPPRILTPHPGEFARLTGDDIPRTDEAREQAAIDFAREKRVVLLLKGHRTIITDGQRLAVNQTGNSGMATGGSGDVLTGLIAALLAQKLPAFEAAQLGAHLHGLAGDLAAAEYSKRGLIASDLPTFIGRAWSHLEQSTD